MGGLPSAYRLPTTSTIIIALLQRIYHRYFDFIRIFMATACSIVDRLRAIVKIKHLKQTLALHYFFHIGNAFGSGFLMGWARQAFNGQVAVITDFLQRFKLGFEVELAAAGIPTGIIR